MQRWQASTDKVDRSLIAVRRVYVAPKSTIELCHVATHQPAMDGDVDPAQCLGGGWGHTRHASLDGRPDHADGSRLPLRTEFRAGGPMALALPLLRWRMGPELQRDVETIKAILESGPPTR